MKSAYLPFIALAANRSAVRQSKPFARDATRCKLSRSVFTALAGMDYGDFLEEIQRLATRRYKDRPPYYHLQISTL